jgi:ribose/xylose/arabinose/galactoside ABC-type transport system permease subunit
LGILPDKRKLALFLVRYGLYLALGVWMLGVAMASEHFLTWLNFLNVARQAAPIAIIAVGMTFVIATAGIDLSVGSLVALVPVISAALLRADLPVWAVLPLVLGVGAAAGAVNSIFVRLGLPAFVVTLAALTYLRGVAFVISDGYAVPVSDEIFNWIGRGRIGIVPVPVILAIIVAAAGWFVLNKTRFGLYVLAVGGREDSARNMGINVGRIKTTVYVATGVLEALGAVVVSARLSNGSPNAGIMMELDVIAATVLGGTSLFGGVATIGGTIAGALFMNFVRNGLNLMGVTPFWVQVVTGVILLLAVVLNTVVNRRVEEWARLSGSDLDGIAETAAVPKGEPGR